MAKDDFILKDSYRIIKNGPSSTIETSEVYFDFNQKKEIPIWVPVSRKLNSLFLTQLKTKTLWKKIQLNNNGKKITCKIFKFPEDQESKFIKNFIHKWPKNKTPGHCLNLKKNQIERYIDYQMEISSLLSSLSKSIISKNNDTKHNSAKYYTRQNTDEIRWELYQFNNYIFERIFMNEIFLKLEPEEHRKTWQSFNSTTEAHYLRNENKKNIIPCIQQNEKKEFITIPPIALGSKHHLNQTDLQLIINNIQEHRFKMSKKRLTKQQYKYFYNHITQELAIKFLILTGSRPNKKIFFQKNKYFNNNIAIINDKNKNRVVYICLFLQEQLTIYQEIQRKILQLYPKIKDEITNEIPFGFLINDENKITFLSRKLINTFLRQHSNLENSYILRHYFSQNLTHKKYLTNLSNHDFNFLMSHANFGEGLGHCFLSPNTKNKIEHHLDDVIKDLNIKSIKFI